MDTTMQAERNVKLPFLRLFLVSSVIIVVVLMPLILMMLLSLPRTGTNQSQVIGVILFIVLLPVLVAAIPIAITTSIYRLSVDAQGIKGRTNTFAPFKVSWADIIAVKPINMLGYPYLLLSTPTYKAKWWEPRYWIPLILSDMAGFRMAVIQYADPDNPLRRYLESRSYT